MPVVIFLYLLLESVNASAMGSPGVVLMLGSEVAALTASLAYILISKSRLPAKAMALCAVIGACAALAALSSVPDYEANSAWIEALSGISVLAGVVGALWILKKT